MITQEFAQLRLSKIYFVIYQVITTPVFVCWHRDTALNASWVFIKTGQKFQERNLPTSPNQQKAAKLHPPSFYRWKMLELQLEKDCTKVSAWNTEHPIWTSENPFFFHSKGNWALVKVAPRRLQVLHLLKSCPHMILGSWLCVALLEVGPDECQGSLLTSAFLWFHERQLYPKLASS